MDITEVSMIHHIGIVLVLLWVLSYFNCCHAIVYIVSLFYLYQVHEHYTLRLRKKLQHEERKHANQKRMLSDSETVRWLNGAVEKIWPICMEQIASQKILLPIVPWFLEKFKPWTAKEALVESLYLGRNPPMFTEIRVLSQYSSDDHVVLELGMNFLAADDMSALLAVKVIGVGMRAKLHMTGMHIEGKVIVGVKFLRDWPYLGRMRVCFSEPPYFQMTVKPIFNHGIDVTEIPGIAGWIDKLLAVAFEQTLVEPNMLVVDVEKFVSSPTDTWFSVDEKDPIAYAVVEIIEGADMKPSDLNGFSDPYVKGQVGTYKFRTRVQKKTLSPKWFEEFKIPICTWESLNLLSIEVCDKDHLYDDALGKCSININELRGEPRRAFWLPLQNIKMGSLHLAVTVVDAERKMEKGSIVDEKQANKTENINSNSSETSQRASTQTTSSKKGPKLADDFEPINIEGQTQTGIWVHHPGSNVSETWEPRKGKKSKLADIKIHREDNDSISTNNNQSPTLGSNQSYESSSDDSPKGRKPKPLGPIRRSLQKIGSAFHRSPKTPKKENSSILGEVVSSDTKSKTEDEISVTSEGSRGEEIVSPDEVSGKKSLRKSIIKHAERSANGIKNKMSKKTSNKRVTDSGPLATNRETLQGPESPGAESLSSSTEDIPLTDNPLESVSLTFSGEEFLVTNEQNIKQAFPEDSKIIMEEPPVREIHLPGVVKAEDDGTLIHSDVSREIQVKESLNSKLPEKSSDTEKMEKFQMEKPIE